jgi:HK97 family phage major capsid protein
MHMETFMQSDLDALRARRVEIVGKLADINHENKSTAGRMEQRQLTAAEQNRVDENYSAFQSLEMELAAVDRDIADWQSHQPIPRALAPIEARAPEAFAPTRRAANAGRTAADIFRGNDDAYSNRFQSFGDFALAVASGGSDRRLLNPSMTEGSGAGGGFLVPTAFLSGILAGAFGQEVIRPNSNVIPMDAPEMNIPGFDFQDRTSAKRAGLALTWGAESSALTEQVATARTIQLKARKASILCRVSSELAEDAVAFDSQLSTAMQACVAGGLDFAYMAGTGSGQPLGIINAAATITIAKESGQAGSTLLLQNLAKMFGSLTPGSYSKAMWLANPTVIPKLMQLAIVVQNVAGAENVGGSTAGAVTFDANGGIRIFGRPVAFTDACAAFSSAGDIVLVDLSQYVIGFRREATMIVDRSVYFASDELGFRLTLRTDGQPSASAATKLRDGTNTVSPFVALGAR